MSLIPNNAISLHKLICILIAVYFKPPIMFKLYQIKVKHKTNMPNQIIAEDYMNKHC